MRIYLIAIVNFGKVTRYTYSDSSMKFIENKI